LTSIRPRQTSRQDEAATAGQETFENRILPSWLEPAVGGFSRIDHVSDWLSATSPILHYSKPV
ncbi:unnamed protein product, partial [Nesidiocoris tenuis]